MNNKKIIRVKVCGITGQDNMLEIAKLQPDYMGFIFYPGSIRDVSDKIKDVSLDQLDKKIKKIAVMVNKPLDVAKGIVEKYGFDIIQLHGNETIQYCRELNSFAPVIKTFPVWNKLPEDMELYKDHCNYFLFDTKTDKKGGSGISFDHKILDEYNVHKPFFLSGGIRPEDASYLRQMKYTYLHAIDINSRFESSPGVKDVESLRRFFKKLEV